VCSNCCGARVIDLGNTGEWLCSECLEMSEDTYENNLQRFGSESIEKTII